MAARSRSFLVVVNPHAGGGRARERMTAVVDALREAGAAFETVLTRRPGDATTLTREALLTGIGGVAVVGGDGTLNEALNGFFDATGEPVAPEAWLGALPCGTGGDFRRSAGISSDVAAMVTRLTWSRPRHIDVGWLHLKTEDGKDVERAFLNIASFGIAGEVDRLVHDGPKWLGGTGAFLLGTVRAVARYRPRRVRVRLDEDEPAELDVLNVAVANGQYFGGGMRIAPNAALEDGLFDVVTVTDRGLSDQARLLPHLYRGSVLEAEGVSLQRARRVVAEPADWAGPILLDVDGEVPGCLPASFEVRPGALLFKG